MTVIVIVYITYVSSQALRRSLSSLYVNPALNGVFAVMFTFVLLAESQVEDLTTPVVICGFCRQ